jgi:hypothetical protein
MNIFGVETNLPIPERINLYNTKGHYFKTLPGGGSNRIKGLSKLHW